MYSQFTVLGWAGTQCFVHARHACHRVHPSRSPHRLPQSQRQIAHPMSPDVTQSWLIYSAALLKAAQLTRGESRAVVRCGCLAVEAAGEPSSSSYSHQSLGGDLHVTDTMACRHYLVNSPLGFCLHFPNKFCPM